MRWDFFLTKMTPREIILQLKDDRFARKSILSYFLTDKNTIKELIHLATIKDEYPVQEHSTWILIHTTENSRDLIEPYQNKIIDAFLESTNQTTLRNLCNVIGKLSLREYKEGELLDSLIAHLKNLDNKVALHVYSLEKINQFVKKYPEIKPEIKEILELKKEVGMAPSMGRVVKEFGKI